MKFIIQVLFGIAIISCQSNLTYDIYYDQIDSFGYFAELRLASNGTCTSIEIDNHSGVGGIANGEFKWHNNLLILNFKGDPNKRFLLLEDGILYRIEEFSSTGDDNFKYNELEQIVEPINKNYLNSFSEESKIDCIVWKKGRIENFDDMVTQFQTEDEHSFDD